MSIDEAIVTEEVCHERMSEQTYCGYEHCQCPIEQQAGHRRKEYCNDTCRQAAHRLRKQREQRGKKTGTPVIASRAQEEERAKYAALLDDFMQASKKIGNLERQVRRFERMKVSQSRESMLQELMILGGRLKYASLTNLGIGEGIDHWLEYVRAASDEDLAKAIAHGYYQADRLAMAAIEASDVKLGMQMQQRINELEAEVQALHRELARYLPPPRELLECSLKRWSTKVSLPYDGWKPERIDAFLRESSERQLLKLLEWAEPTYFIGEHRRRRIAIIQQHLDEVKPYCGDPALAVVKMDEKGHATFANGQQRFMGTDDIQYFWAQIVGKQGQQAVGGNPQVAPIQQYLCEHSGEAIPICQGKRQYEIVFLADDTLAVTKKHNPLKLYEDEIEQALQWINRDIKSESRLVELEGVAP